MPIGYLFTVIVVAVITLLALIPARSFRAFAQPRFIVTLGVNELPFYAFAWLCIATIVLFQENDAYSPGAWIGVSIAVLTLVGLTIILIRAVRARSVASNALDAALGVDWQNALNKQARLRWQRALPYPRLLLIPWWMRRRGVHKTRNIPYGPDARRNRLDVYRHPSVTRGAPMLVYFHGGGYFSGRKTWEAQSLLYRLARQGWVCVSADYRLRPQATFRDHLLDAKRAIAWARAHGPEYGADTSIVVGAGSSAGAHLASICALTSSDATMQPGFGQADTSLDAVVCMYGYYGYYDGMARSDDVISSPMGYDVSAAPPFLLAHGDHDTQIPVEGARAFAARLANGSSNPAVYMELPGAQHAFDMFRSVRFEAVSVGIDAFLSWVAARH